MAGIPMIEHVLRVVGKLSPAETVVVVSPENRDDFLGLYGNLYEVAVQEQPLGTGDAVSTSLPHISSEAEFVLVLPGDVPLITIEALARLLENASGGEGALLTFKPTSPRGYGRIIRDEEGYFVSKVVEDADADEETRAVAECNSGIYAFERKWLPEVLQRAQNEFGTKNAKGEYYLTDVLNFLRMIPVSYENQWDLMGINDRVQLGVAENILQERIIGALAREGVTFVRAETSYVEANVCIGADSVVYPGCILRGDTSIGENCEIGPMCYLENARIGNDCKVIYSHLVQVHGEDGVKIGPFANLRPGTLLAENAKIGDFVEIKNSKVGKGSKVPHLSYVGDAEIGSGVNVGAGTITCNYDGFDKFKTIIEDEVFIGSNNTLVAPVRIGRGSYTAAGSTINKDVPEDALAIGRARQENKEGYAKKLRQKKKKEKAEEPEEAESASQV